VFQLDGKLATSATFHLYTNAHWMFALMVLVLESITIQLPAVSLSCFKYTCASVAIVVGLLPAAALLLGTIGLVLNVFVPYTV
jgi:hypothetical protein